MAMFDEETVTHNSVNVNDHIESVQHLSHGVVHLTLARIVRRRGAVKTMGDREQKEAGTTRRDGHLKEKL